ncbi:DUF3718 domain-containing protein [Aliikangiella sp. G2MR2-5]|uniref:DUF3718 domain-containing protein n=1 Tax=Aliikangiella sp. G2MR2-5 TaxID=2788943 RepID=UPI0018A92F8B|nr:DUF3718 domain-containing protein [Aliikangiella sp. G2MR2-5]
MNHTATYAKKFMILMAFFISGIFSQHSLGAQENGFYQEKLVEKLCQSVKQDNLARFRKTLKDSRTHLTQIYPVAECSGASLIDFATLNQSELVLAYIARKTEVRDLQAYNQTQSLALESVSK